MAQWIRALAVQARGPEFKSPTRHGHAHTWNPSTVGVQAGWLLSVASLAPGSVWDPASRNKAEKGKRRSLMSSTGLSICMGTHMCRHYKKIDAMSIALASHCYPASLLDGSPGTVMLLPFLWVTFMFSKPFNPQDLSKDTEASHRKFSIRVLLTTASFLFKLFQHKTTTRRCYTQASMSSSQPWEFSSSFTTFCLSSSAQSLPLEKSCPRPPKF